MSHEAFLSMFEERLGCRRPESAEGLGAFLARARDAGIATEGRAPSIDERVLALLAPHVLNGHTWFFRDPEQLESIVALAGRAARPAQIWCAGCSSGEEPYSIAMLAQRHAVSVRITGSDMSEEALRRAQAGRYSAAVLRHVPEALRAQFLPVGADQVEVRQEVRAEVQLVRHNLAGPALCAEGGWDLVVCRNVLIHFRNDQARATVERLAEALAPDGVIVLGAADVMVPGVAEALEPIGVGRRHVHRRRRPPRASDPPPDQVPREPRVVPPSWLSIGDEEVTAGRYGRALEAYGRALALDPDRAETHLRIGLCHRGAGDPEAAIGSLRRAAYLDEHLWQAWAVLATLYEAAGLPERARAALEAARAALVRNGSAEVPEVGFGAAEAARALERGRGERKEPHGR